MSGIICPPSAVCMGSPAIIALQKQTSKQIKGILKFDCKDQKSCETENYFKK